MKTIDLNCDMGESFGAWRLGEDEALLDAVTSANIACGWHAGDPQMMEQTVRMAVEHGVNIGAHPGYPDLQGFGRREMNLSAEEVEALTLYQIGALAGFCRAFRCELTHVKPHGALYNQAARDPRLAEAIARGVKRFSSTLMLVGLAGSMLVEAGSTFGLCVVKEGFPDRAYEPDGVLRSRSLPGAVLETDQEVCEQAVRLALEGIVVNSGSTTRKLAVDTLCIHGDHAGAAARAQAVRNALESVGVRVEALSNMG